MRGILVISQQRQRHQIRSRRPTLLKHLPRVGLGWAEVFGALIDAGLARAKAKHQEHRRDKFIAFHGFISKR